MKGLVWFVIGIAGGFVVAHFANKTARGQLLFAELELASFPTSFHMHIASRRRSSPIPPRKPSPK